MFVKDGKLEWKTDKRQVKRLTYPNGNVSFQVIKDDSINTPQKPSIASLPTWRMSAEQEEKMVQQLCLKIHDLQGDAAKATAIPRKWITGRNVKEYERLPQHILNASIKNQTPIALSVEHGESLRINFLIHTWIFYFRLNNFSSILQTNEMSSKTKLFCRW